MFGDPRFGARQRNFHFGIDIPASGGTPVYAVAAGTAYREPDHVDVLSRVDGPAVSGFSYWHIIPAISEHAWVTPHMLLGWINPVWDHVHLAEILNGRWVNPLRPGGLAPFHDPSKPILRDAEAVAIGVSRVTLTVSAFVPPPSTPPSPWRDARLAPSLIRWRLLSRWRPVSAWHVAVDFRDYLPPNTDYSSVYTRATTPNRPGVPGHYVFYLARGWNTSRLRPSSYRIEVQAVATEGETTTVFARVSRRAM